MSDGRQIRERTLSLYPQRRPDTYLLICVLPDQRFLPVSVAHPLSHLSVLPVLIPSITLFKRSRCSFAGTTLFKGLLCRPTFLSDVIIRRRLLLGSPSSLFLRLSAPVISSVCLCRDDASTFHPALFAVRGVITRRQMV